MKKKLLIAISSVINSVVFAQDYSSSSGSTIDLLFSGGYTSITIQNNEYTGYSAVAKVLFPFMGAKDLSVGLGIKYDYATYDPPSVKNNTSYSHQYDTLMAGIDLGYKFDFSWLLILFNPYAYYSFYDTWLQTTNTPTYQQTYSPYIIHNLNYGLGVHFLFKIASGSGSGFYLGPSAYYSGGYIVYQNANDSKGNSYTGGEGSYSLYSADFTIGMYF